MLYRCRECLNVVALLDTKHKHDCKHIKCSVCQEKYETAVNIPQHVCYFKITNFAKQLTSFSSTVYYDFETVLDDNQMHIPVLCVANTVCNNCKHIDIDNAEYICTLGNKPCGPRQMIFKHNAAGVDVTNQFIDWFLLLHKRKKFSNLFLIAHCGARFDAFIIYINLIHRQDDDLHIGDPIRKGNSIMHLIVNGNIIFKDSYNFLTIALNKFPKTLALDENLYEKGNFPYKFMTFNNLNYEGVCPSLDYFDITRMNEKQIADVKKLIASFDNRQYNLMNECVRYCISDVSILRAGMTKYRKMYIDEFQIDPLRSALTLASLCMKVFTTHFLKENLIPVIDRYRGRCYSYLGIELSSYLAFKLQTICKHARTAEGEMCVKIAGRLFYFDGAVKVPDVDDYITISTHGCYYHGCQNQQCLNVAGGYKGSSFRGGLNPIDIYENTKKDDIIKGEHTRHFSIWEHTLKVLKQTGKDSNGYDYKFNDPLLDSIPNLMLGYGAYVREYGSGMRRKYLDLNSCLAGGRTNAYKLYETLKDRPHHKILYYDVASLYPYIHLTVPMPIGPPIKRQGHNLPTVEEFTLELKEGNFSGLASVDILCPQDLKLPLLYKHIDGKLIFPVCFKCANERVQDPELVFGDCNHTIKQRQLSNTYSTPELNYAVKELHYTIMNIYEVWDFKQEIGVFAAYQKTFLRNKIEASGLPSSGPYVNDLAGYCTYIQEQQKIVLRPEKVIADAPRRSIAKGACNSLWGKTAERQHCKITHICENGSELCDIAFNEGNKVLEILEGPRRCVIMYEPKHVDAGIAAKFGEKQLSNVNLPIAIRTTGAARLLLYELLKKVPSDSLLYYDTDSLLFVQDTRLPMIHKVGNLIGDLTDELSSYGPLARCTEFVSTGPKSYGLRIETPDQEDRFIIKSKGITITNDTKELVSFENLCRIVKENFKIKIPTTRFKLKRFTGPIVQHSEKTLQFTYSKRKIIQNFCTRPWGWAP
jgi:hypothetical protein